MKAKNANSNKAPSQFKADKVQNVKVDLYGDNTMGQPGRDVGEVSQGKPHPMPVMDARGMNVYTKSGVKTYRADGDNGSVPQSRYRSRRP
jgi:hypothetical protein